MVDPELLRRLLVIRFGRLGDLLTVTPAIRALRRALPDARIDVLSGELGLPALETSHSVNELHLLRWRKVPRILNPERALLLRRLRRVGFDAVFLLETSDLYRRLADDVRAPRIYCSPDPGQAPDPDSGGAPCPRHQVDRVLAAVAEAGIAPAGRHYDFPVSDAARRRAGSLLEAAGASPTDTVVGLHAGHHVGRFRRGPHAKEWPTRRYVEVVGGLIDRGADLVVLTGTALEADVNTAITRSASHGRVVDFSGRTELETLAALMERCALFVTPDTGPGHLAAAMGTPLVSLFGPKSPEIMGPIGDPAKTRWIYREPSQASETEREGHHPRMWAITVSDVLAAVDDLGALRSR
ncbi:MAG: glycosyltransferase family 9 protein [Gemmatimonadales bacterium]|jgi:heptosyltransferase-2/heptosyltransferase-3